MNNSASSAPVGADQPQQPGKASKSFFTIDRIIIYLLLLVFIGAVFNDRHILAKVNAINDVVYQAGIKNGSKYGSRTEKNGNQLALDQLSEAEQKKLLEAVTRPSRFQAWMKEKYGVEPDKELSKAGADYFIYSSGIRIFQLKITYNASAELAKYDRGAVGNCELTTYYFWQSPEDAI
jgi:hypothetical protein